MLVKYDSSGTAQWARTVESGPDDSEFISVSVDSSGNIYAAGWIYDTAEFNFGNGKTATGTSIYNNVVLVKYDSSGTAQWARTVESGTADSKFRSVSVDTSGNIYAAGYIKGTSEFNFGNGKTATGTSIDNNVVLVKYDSSGTAQWARTVESGTADSKFKSVSVDTSGNIYAAGGIFGTSEFNFGNNKTATGTSIDNNVVLVKYDSSGTAQWARTVGSGTESSEFKSVSSPIDGIYAAGYIQGTFAFGFGNGKTAAGTSNGYNAVLVKYDSSGTTQWARTVASGTADSEFHSVSSVSSVSSTIDGIYAAGYIQGTSAFGFGNGKTATGKSDDTNVVLVKYDLYGTAQWARTVASGTRGSGFNSLSVDSSGNIYAAGWIYGLSAFDFGNNKTITGPHINTNVVLVKYYASDEKK